MLPVHVDALAGEGEGLSGSGGTEQHAQDVMTSCERDIIISVTLSDFYGKIPLSPYGFNPEPDVTAVSLT